MIILRLILNTFDGFYYLKGNPYIYSYSVKETLGYCPTVLILPVYSPDSSVG